MYINLKRRRIASQCVQRHITKDQNILKEVEIMKIKKIATYVFRNF